MFTVPMYYKRAGRDVTIEVYKRRDKDNLFADTDLLLAAFYGPDRNEHADLFIRSKEDSIIWNLRQRQEVAADCPTVEVEAVKPPAKKEKGRFRAFASKTIF